MLNENTDGVGTEKVTEFCGNNKVEGDEQCDAGVGDKCCSASCQLIAPAVCRYSHFSAVTYCPQFLIIGIDAWTGYSPVNKS